MDRYYYFVAQLPFLSFHDTPPLSVEHFLQEAQKWLSEKDFAYLFMASLNNMSQNERIPQTVGIYRAFEQALRESLAHLRGAADIKPDVMQLEKTKAILREGDPLEKEKKLLFARWQYIEELETGHFFDIDFIILYYLKLQVLERLFSFDKEKGQKIFDALCEVAQ